jgi:hypothetical protein
MFNDDFEEQMQNIMDMKTAALDMVLAQGEEVFEKEAQIHRIRYKAFIKAGFTEAQTIPLICAIAQGEAGK